MGTPIKSMKVIGKNGQLSLGKEFSGRLVETLFYAPGKFVVNLGTFTSDFETKYFSEEDHQKIEANLVRMASIEPVETDLNELENILEQHTSA